MYRTAIGNPRHTRHGVFSIPEPAEITAAQIPETAAPIHVDLANT